MPRTTLEINAKDNASKTLDNVKKKSDDVGKSIGTIGKIGAGVVFGKGLEEAAKMIWQGMVKAAESSKSFKDEMTKVSQSGNEVMKNFGSIIGTFGTDILKSVNGVIDSFNKWFKSAEGIEIIATAGAHLQAVFNSVGKILGPLGSILTPVITTIKELLSVLGAAGNVLIKVFSGDLKGAAEAIKQLGKEGQDYIKSIANVYTTTGKAIAQTVTATSKVIGGEYVKDVEANKKRNQQKLESDASYNAEAIALAQKQAKMLFEMETAYAKQEEQAKADKQAKLEQGGKMLYDSLASTSNAYYESQLANENLSAEQKKKLQTEQFIVNKAMSVGNAIMNTAQAVTAALTVPVVGPILAGIVGGLGAVQVGMIMSTPVPAFAMGGQTAGGMALVGERGPELVQLPAGSNVINNTETRNMMNNGTNIYFNGNILANDPIEFYRKLSIQTARAEAGR